MAAARMRNVLVRENVSSSDKWDMFSNPMKAQGDMHAMRTIWESALLSGRKPGSNDPNWPAWPEAAAMKHTVMPTQINATHATITCASAFLARMHTSATMRIAAIESSASPRYTS